MAVTVAGLRLSPLVTGPVDRATVAGVRLSPLLAGPLGPPTPLTGMQQLQGANPQGTLLQGASLNLRPFQGVPLAVT